MAIILLMLFFVILVTTFLITDKGFNYALPDSTFAQQSGNVTFPLNKTQEWISQKDNVKILFAYQPERPIIDAFTKLEFTVINLTNNENLKDFNARVVVTNGQRLFKFENISVPDGDYSVEYIFPDDGTHQVITRVNKGTDVQVLASFNVFVPHQGPPNLLNPSQNASASDTESLTRVLTIVISFAIVTVVIFMLRRGKRRKRKEESL